MKWEATSSGQTTLWFFFFFPFRFVSFFFSSGIVKISLLLLELSSPHSSLPREKEKKNRKVSLMSLPAPALSLNQSENGTQDVTPPPHSLHSSPNGTRMSDEHFFFLFFL